MEHDPNSKLPDDDANQSGSAISESRMRQALGIDARGHDRHLTSSHGTNAPRRRFVADGDVPVVMIGRRRDHASGERAEPSGPLSDRMTTIEAALATERDARHRAETLLAEARHTIQHLQTQLAHADLARDEAQAQARRAMADRGEALQELQAAQRPQPTETPAPPLAAPEPAPTPTPTLIRAVPAGRPRRGGTAAQIACDVPAYTAQILAAYLARNALSPVDLPVLANSVVQALVAATPTPVIRPEYAQPTKRMMPAEPQKRAQARRAAR